MLHCMAMLELPLQEMMLQGSRVLGGGEGSAGEKAEERRRD